MFSSLLYEKWEPVRERNMTLLLETVTYIALAKNSHLHTYNRNSHVHNALWNIPPAQLQKRLPPA